MIAYWQGVPLISCTCHRQKRIEELLAVLEFRSSCRRVSFCQGGGGAMRVSNAGEYSGQWRNSCDRVGTALCAFQADGETLLISSPCFTLPAAPSAIADATPATFSGLSEKPARIDAFEAPPSS